MGNSGGWPGKTAGFGINSGLHRNRRYQKCVNSGRHLRVMGKSHYTQALERGQHSNVIFKLSQGVKRILSALSPL